MSDIRETMPRRRVALFVTCLVDLFRPQVGFAAVKLLQDAGCDVEVPRAQTCCGQPAYNSGAAEDARAVARRVVEAFEGYDHIVAPSGACAGVIREHYPALFAAEPAMRSEEHTSELQSLMRISYAVFCLKKKKQI